MQCAGTGTATAAHGRGGGRVDCCRLRWHHSNACWAPHLAPALKLAIVRRPTCCVRHPALGTICHFRIANVHAGAGAREMRLGYSETICIGCMYTDVYALPVDNAFGVIPDDDEPRHKDKYATAHAVDRLRELALNDPAAADVSDGHPTHPQLRLAIPPILSPPKAAVCNSRYYSLVRRPRCRP